MCHESNKSKRGKRFSQRGRYRNNACKCVREKVKGKSQWLSPQTGDRSAGWNECEYHYSIATKTLLLC